MKVDTQQDLDALIVNLLVMDVSGWFWLLNNIPPTLKFVLVCLLFWFMIITLIKNRRFLR